VQTNQADQSKYLRVFGNEKSENATYIGETMHGGVFIGGGTYDDSSMTGMRFDKNGHYLNSSAIRSSRSVYTMGIHLKSGGFMMSSGYSSQLARFSEEGNLLASKMFDVSLSASFVFSSLYEGDDGLLYSGYCDGPASGAPSQSYISQLDLDGNELQYFGFTDFAIGGKVLQVQIMGKKDNMLYIAGSFVPHPWTWSDNPKHYVLNLDMQSGQISNLKTFDLLDDSEEDLLVKSLTLTNGEMATLISPNMFLRNSVEKQRVFEVFKYDNALNTIWRKRFDIGATAVVPTDIVSTSDGGMLITGFCHTPESVDEHAFFLKLDKSGGVSAQKIFQIAGRLRFSSCIESKDGRFLFTGTSNSFGVLKDLSTPIILATDRQGNFE